MTAFERAIAAAAEQIDQAVAESAELTELYGVLVEPGVRAKVDADGVGVEWTIFFEGRDRRGQLNGLVTAYSYGGDYRLYGELLPLRAGSSDDDVDRVGPLALVEPDELIERPAAEPDEPVAVPLLPVVPVPEPAADRPRIRAVEDYNWRPIDRLFR